MKTAYDFDQVSIVPNVSGYKSRKEAFDWLIQEPRIIAANMHGIGTEYFAERVSFPVALTVKHALRSDMPENIIPTVGENKSESNFPLIPLQRYFDTCIIDVANAYRTSFLNKVRDHKTRLWKDRTLIVGNVCDYRGTWNLLKAGADIVKVGIGSGSLCTTRRIAGVGIPQVTAIMEARRAVDLWNNLHPFSKPRMICSDGGITEPGDVAKALVAGADYVMIGGMFMEAIDVNSHEFRGSSVINFHGEYKTSEGKNITLLKKRSQTAEEIYKEIVAGLASCATYIGANSYKEFRKKGRLVHVGRITNNKFDHLT